jgi:uncharacterized cupredoxin-like copper-binding protein
MRRGRPRQECPPAKRLIGLLGGALAAALVGPWQAQAVDLSRQDAVELTVQLGDKDDTHVFAPNSLNLETGKLYKLVLANDSPSKHCFSSPAFAAAIWTRKVQTEQAEIKGPVREIQLNPAGRVEWWFVPVQAGTFELTCTVDGHAESGMVGLITVE